MFHYLSNIHNYSCYNSKCSITDTAQSQFILILSSLHQGNGCPQPLASVSTKISRIWGVTSPAPICSALSHPRHAQKPFMLLLDLSVCLPVGVWACCPCPLEEAACCAAFCFNIVQSNV